MVGLKIRKKGASKGAFNIDLIISISIFIIGMFFFVQIISHAITSYELEANQEIKARVARSVSATLFGSEGVPKNWNDDPTNAKQLGLCVNYIKICLISPAKLSALSSMTAQETKELLNLEDYDFQVFIKDNNNNLLFEYKSAELGKFLGIHQYRCLLIDDPLKQVITTVQVW